MRPSSLYSLSTLADQPGLAKPRSLLRLAATERRVLTGQWRKQSSQPLELGAARQDDGRPQRLSRMDTHLRGSVRAMSQDHGPFEHSEPNSPLLACMATSRTRPARRLARRPISHIRLPRSGQDTASTRARQANARALEHRPCGRALPDGATHPPMGKRRRRTRPATTTRRLIPAHTP
jgi:hypothetical protein